MSISADHNIIQGNIPAYELLSPIDRSLQHHSLFNLIISSHQLIQCAIQRLLVNLCQKSQMSQINTQKRNVFVHHISGSLKQCSVSSQNNNAFCILRNFRGIRIVKISLLLSGCPLHSTAFMKFFQVFYNPACKRKFRILVTVCNNIKPVHNIRSC